MAESRLADTWRADTWRADTWRAETSPADVLVAGGRVVDDAASCARRSAVSMART